MALTPKMQIKGYRPAQKGATPPAPPGTAGRTRTNVAAPGGATKPTGFGKPAGTAPMFKKGGVVKGGKKKK